MVVFSRDVIFNEGGLTQHEPKKYVCLEYPDEPLDTTSSPLLRRSEQERRQTEF